MSEHPAPRRFRPLVASLLLGLALGIAPGCGDSDDGNDDSGFDFGSNDPNLVVCIGDSITAWGYPGYLAPMINKSTINGGVPGAPSADAIRSSGNAVARQPGYMLILYGANDVIYGFSHEEVIANLRAALNTARDNKTIPCLATLTPMTGPEEGLNGQVIALNERIKQLAATEDVRLADLYDEFQGKLAEYLEPDGLHPTEAGSQAIAARFADACF